MYKGYNKNKSRKVAISILILLSILVSVAYATNQVTRKEFKELQEYTSIGGNEIADVKEGLREFIRKVYAPTSQEDIDKSFNSIEKYCTESLIQTLKGSTNSFKEEAKQGVKIVDVLYGQSETRRSILCNFIVDFNGVYPESNTFMEFYLNSEGKIYDYDMWVY